MMATWFTKNVYSSNFMIYELDFPGFVIMLEISLN